MHACNEPIVSLSVAARRRTILATLPALAALAALSALAFLQGCASTPGTSSGTSSGRSPGTAPASRTGGGAGAAPAPSPGDAGTAGRSAAAPRTGAGATPSAPAERAQNPLTTEREWLQSWFGGTPVQIEQQGDGPVSIAVPLEFCFDAGSSRLLPALAAVLDKVAQSLRRTPQAQLQTLAAPGDSAAASPLAMQRARQVRARLLSRGAAAVQLAPPTATPQASVQLLLALPSP